MALEYILASLDKINQRLDRIETMPIWNAIGVLPITNGGTGGSSLAAASIVTGTGAANQLAYWSGTNGITSGSASVTHAGNLVIGSSAINMLSTGQIGQGVAAATNIGHRIAIGLSGSTSQVGTNSRPSYSSAATTEGIAFEVHNTVQNAAFTMSALYGLKIDNSWTKGASATVTDAYGVYIGNPNITTANNTYSIYINGPSGGSVGNWSIYSTSGANYFGGSVLIGTTSAPSGGGTPVLVLAQASANPTGMGSNTAGFFAKDVSGTCEAFAIDEAGNVTQLSAHHDVDGAIASGLTIPESDPFPRVEYEANVYLGVEAWTYTAPNGQRQRVTREWPPEQRQDWDANQDYHQAQRQAEQAQWDAALVQYQAALAAWDAADPEMRGAPPQRPLGERPADYVYKPMPGWMARRLAAKKAQGK